MKIRKAMCITLSSVMALTMTACGSSAQTAKQTASSQTAAASAAPSSAGSTAASKAASGDQQEVDFWSAPNQQQFDFWSSKADAFNATKATVNGKTIVVKVQQMPESPSSEAGIQNSIVTGTVPAASENVSAGFAALLAQDDAVYALQDDEAYKDIVKNRDMADACKGWEINGKQYVIPIFINAMSYEWNAKALTALGFSEPPKTVDEFKKVIKAFMDNKDTKMKDLGVQYTMYRSAFTRSDQWWERWYDFQMQYMSFAKGAKIVDGNKLVMDKDAAAKTFELYGLLGNTVMTDNIDGLWTQDQVPVLFSISAPWDVNAMTQAGKVYGKDYVYGPSIVENAGDTAYSFADSKGVVFYKNKAVTDDEHQGAVDFISWVYSADNAAQSDLDFWNTTKMMPLRGDISTNKVFADVIAKEPALAGISQFIPNAVPCMTNAKMTEIQTALGESGLIPYMSEAMNSDPLKAPDASKYIDDAIAAMKTAGGLE